MRCPFHEDQTASGSIHTDNGSEVLLYTCHGCTWNGPKTTGDIVDVVRRAGKLDFKSACARLGVNGNGKPRQNALQPRGEEEPAATDLAVEQDAHAAHERLLSDPEALAHLWRTRGIVAATATTFKIGITGKPGSRFWIFPIAEHGRVIGIKAHRADGQAAKSWWKPDGIGRDHLFPVHLQGEGPAWLLPGELKAPAVAGLGLPAGGITSGEGSEKKPADLPLEALEVLRGRSAAIVADADATGRVWGEHVQEQLTDAGIDARLVDLGLDKASGLKDIGDWLRVRLVDHQRDSESVAAELDEAYRRSDPWFGVRLGDLWADPATWKAVTKIPTGLIDLDHALGGGLRTRGVHLFGGKSGKAKTQLAVAVAGNAAKADIPSVVISLELGADEVAQLVAAQLGNIPRLSLAAGQVTGECLERLQGVRRERGGIPLDVLDDRRWPGGLTRDGLGRLVAEGVKRFGWRLVVVDYLGLLAAPESDRSDYQTDLLNSSALRKLARLAQFEKNPRDF